MLPPMSLHRLQKGQDLPRTSACKVVSSFSSNGIVNVGGAGVSSELANAKGVNPVSITPSAIAMRLRIGVTIEGQLCVGLSYGMLVVRAVMGDD